MNLRISQAWPIHSLVRGWFLAIALITAPFVGNAAALRVALVVGNSAYENVSPLDNPKNDAQLIARTLKEQGFTLVGDGAQLNLDKAAMDKAVQAFGRQLQGAEVALFYYAGHGVQLRGTNYLVPVNANPTREADVDFQMLDVNLVLRQMDVSGTRLNLVILDACRNNPFGARGLRGTEPGLAQMRAPEGTLISYATQPGNVAQDGADGDSPYTEALAATIRRPGLDIFQTFNEVGLNVKRVTGGAQQPWTSASPIDGNFYFAGTAAPAKTAVPTSAADHAQAPRPTDTLRLDLITDCDRLVASPTDPTRPKGIPGVEMDKVDIVSALTACRDAMRQYPDVARFAFQSGRIATIQKDWQRARPLYEQAASLGSGAAMNNLGTTYMEGKGVAVDQATAAKWFERAANAGVALGITNLGQVDLRKSPPDYADARARFEQAAAVGEPAAMWNLGKLYQNGHGVPLDLGTARKWYLKAAEGGSASAMVDVGFMYEKGLGTKVDLVEARDWYERGAAANNPMALNNLGGMYDRGDGGRKDPVEARKLWERAAAASNTRAMNSLGAMYLLGDGVAKDMPQARKWFQEAADAGDNEAKAMIDKFNAAEKH